MYDIMDINTTFCHRAKVYFTWVNSLLRLITGYFFINFEHLLLYFGEECGDFVNIGYSYHISCIAHASNIAFGSVPNLTNFGHFFLHLGYLLGYLREEWVDFIHIWYSNQVTYM